MRHNDLSKSYKRRSLEVVTVIQDTEVDFKFDQRLFRSTEHVDNSPIEQNIPAISTVAWCWRQKAVQESVWCVGLQTLEQTEVSVRVIGRHRVLRLFTMIVNRWGGAEVWRVNKLLDLSVTGCQQPIRLPCFLDSLAMWFCSASKSFGHECKINVKLITAIQSFPLCYNSHLKGCRTKNLQHKGWGRLAFFIGFDSDLESKCTDFPLFIVHYSYIISPCAIMKSNIFLPPSICQNKTSSLAVKNRKLAWLSTTHLQNIQPQPLCQPFASRAARSMHRKWKTQTLATKQKE